MDWERLTGESSKAFEAFCMYRDMGTQRTIVKLRDIYLQKYGKKVSNRTLEAWSVKYHWVARARAYDDHIEELKREAHEKAIIEMTERQAAIAKKFQTVLIERLQTLNPDELTPTDMSRWFDIAARIERLNRGEPTEINTQHIKGGEDIFERLSRYNQVFKTSHTGGDSTDQSLDTD